MELVSVDGKILICKSKKNDKPGRKWTLDGWHYCGFCEFRSRDYDYMNDVHIPKHTKGWPK